MDSRLPLSTRRNFRNACQKNDVSWKDVIALFYRAANSPEKMEYFLRNHKTIFDPDACKCCGSRKKKPTPARPVWKERSSTLTEEQREELLIKNPDLCALMGRKYKID